ncbi:hypothetical protein JOM56_009866 [Amanita muscaria]
MSVEYLKTAPRIWSLLDALLSVRTRRRSSLLLEPNRMTTGENLGGHWTGDNRDEQRLEGTSTRRTDSTSPDTESSKKENRKNTLSQIKKTVILSMLMHGANQKANKFASIFGIFLHSCRTPQRVVNALQRMGLCVMQTTIHSAINSLSASTSEKLLALGESGCIAIAYDNFDVDLKISVPVVEKSGDSLRHLTSGLMFVLQHGVKTEDLRCSDYLWQRSEYNPLNIGMQMQKKTYYDLLDLLREDKDVDCSMEAEGLSDDDDDKDSRKKFNTWVFLRDLFKHVDGFEDLRDQLEEPEEIEKIPVAKTEIYPAYAMDVNNSTVNGNIQAIELSSLSHISLIDPTVTSLPPVFPFLYYLPLLIFAIYLLLTLNHHHLVLRPLSPPSSLSPTSVPLNPSSSSSPVTSKLLPETVHPTSPYTLQSSTNPHSVATCLPRRRQGIDDLRALAAEQALAQQQQLQTTRRLFGQRTHLHTSDQRRQAQVFDLPDKELRHLFRKFQLAEYPHTQLPSFSTLPSPPSPNPPPTTNQRVVRFMSQTPPSQRTTERHTLEDRQTSSLSTQSSETSGPHTSSGYHIQPLTNKGTALRPFVINHPEWDLWKDFCKSLDPPQELNKTALFTEEDLEQWEAYKRSRRRRLKPIDTETTPEDPQVAELTKSYAKLSAHDEPRTKLPATMSGSALRENENNKLFRKVVAEPDNFDGNKRKFHNWWKDMQLWLMGYEDLGNTPKIIAVLTRLTSGDAAEWARAKKTSLIDGTAMTWDGFKTELVERFDDPSRTMRAQNTIHQCFQGNNQSAQAYIDQFSVLKSTSGLTDAEALFLFRRGINRDMSLAMYNSNQTIPSTYSEFVTMKPLRLPVLAPYSTTIDTRQMNGHRLNLWWTRPTYGDWVGSPETKREKGACFYCSKMGHQAKECRKKKMDYKGKTSKVKKLDEEENIEEEEEDAEHAEDMPDVDMADFIEGSD